MNNDPIRVGELRTSQLLHTFGIGALVDLPNLSVVVRGLDAWKSAHAAPLQEDRLLDAVRRKLGPQVKELRSPPWVPSTANVFDEWAKIGVPVSAFPRWLRCTKCHRLSSADSGAFDLISTPYSPDRTRYVHGCRGEGNRRPAAVPARFVMACEAGHLDDFPWVYFAHRGQVPETGEHTLKLVEQGTTGEAASVLVICEGCNDDPNQGGGRSMGEAFGPENAVNLPRCRGRHPHLAAFESCDQEPRTMVLGATNSWFPTQMRVFSLPQGDTALKDAVAEHMTTLGALAVLPKEQVEHTIRQMVFWADLDEFGFDAVWDEVQAQAADAQSDDTAPPSEDEEVDLAGPEWEAFTQPKDVDLPDFTTKHVGRVAKNHRERLAEVVLVPRLRVVSALYGFTRVDAPEFDVVTTDDNRIAPLSAKAPEWVPCAEQRGEGIFLRFAEEPLAAWESAPAVKEREKQLTGGHERWRQARNLPPADWPGMRYALLHSLAHCLIRELSLEAGYSASGIAEKVYARGGSDAMAGILLYTAAPDSEGTLGGLVALGADPDRLGLLIDHALDAARLCSSDPLCAEHDPDDHARLHGAACHVCLFASETSCERNNHYLDRTLLVDTISQDLPAGLGYFR
ncbi:hypothetical protein BJF83_06285 [Nocardiopsis sp. CNR-923]|uniref:DUF1998 domain-containing protein n=1 Tax=Nocardiopsis sp. CNR-923 TaxID=1904965 RepID=UPI000964BBDA|nr:DUF1998 domain-containing protein [Nocardiopsis sp. CNR-923]OLT24595.1 hypothetical protein BJF83_06285 [Nocardiopsis sp. CNR-923]